MEHEVRVYFPHDYDQSHATRGVLADSGVGHMVPLLRRVALQAIRAENSRLDGNQSAVGENFGRDMGSLRGLYDLLPTEDQHFSEMWATFRNNVGPLWGLEIRSCEWGSEEMPSAENLFEFSSFRVLDLGDMPEDIMATSVYQHRVSGSCAPRRGFLHQNARKFSGLRSLGRRK